MDEPDEALKEQTIEFIRQWQRQSQPIGNLVVRVSI
jgi:hypothetical protein